MQNFKNLFILEKNNNLKDYFFINLISLLISSTFVCIFFISRIRLENKNTPLTFKVLIISYFIILFPIFLSGVLSFFQKKNIADFIKYEPFFSLAGLSLVIIFSLVSPFINLIILIVVLSFIYLLYFLIVFIRNKFFVSKDFFIIAIVIFLSLFILFTLWSSKFLLYYFSPIFYEKLFTGKVFIDPVFNGAVANMIKNYGIPSTGLNGTTYLPYHYLSHWIFAQFSKLLDVNVLQFYEIGYPVIFLSLFFKFFFLGIKNAGYKVKNFIDNRLFWVLFLLVFTGLFPKFVLERFFVSHFIIISESYNLSITLSLLTFLMIAFFRDKNSNGKIFLYSKSAFFIILLPLLIFLIGLSKSSTLVIFVAVLFYLFIRYACYKKLVYNLGGIFVIISTFLSLRATTQAGFENSEFQLFHFFNVVIQKRNEGLLWPVTLILFIIIYFFWSISFIFLETINLKKSYSGSLINNFKEKKTIKIEVVILICLIGILPGIFLIIGGGSANYFSELQKWVSIILLLSLFASQDFIHIDIKRIIKKPIRIFIIVVIIILIFSIIFNFVTEFRSFYDDYSQNKKEYNLIIDNDIEDDMISYRTKLVKVILELDRLSISEKQNSILYIPVDNTEFWDLKILPKSLSVPLLVPAVSGIAMIYGLPDEGLIYTKNFGYSVYRTTSKRVMDKNVDELFYEIKQKGYRNLILLDYKNGEFSIDFINESNIEEYETNIYKLFRRLYYYSFGEHIEFEKLYGIIENLKNGELLISEIIPEIILDNASLINSKDNKGFIESLYLILLDREYDEIGLRHWLEEIEVGRSRGYIIESFLNSSEVIQKYEY